MSTAIRRVSFVAAAIIFAAPAFAQTDQGTEARARQDIETIGSVLGNDAPSPDERKACAAAAAELREIRKTIDPLGGLWSDINKKIQDTKRDKNRRCAAPPQPAG